VKKNSTVAGKLSSVS
jgi:hypothetical protein